MKKKSSTFLIAYGASISTAPTVLRRPVSNSRWSGSWRGPSSVQNVPCTRIKTIATPSATPNSTSRPTTGSRRGRSGRSSTTRATLRPVASHERLEGEIDGPAPARRRTPTCRRRAETTQTARASRHMDLADPQRHQRRRSCRAASRAAPRRSPRPSRMFRAPGRCTDENHDRHASRSTMIRRGLLAAGRSDIRHGFCHVTDQHERDRTAAERRRLDAQRPPALGPCAGPRRARVGCRQPMSTPARRLQRRRDRGRPVERAAPSRPGRAHRRRSAAAAESLRRTSSRP